MKETPSENVSHETSKSAEIKTAHSAQGWSKPSGVQSISWKDAGQRLGIWNSGWLSGSGAKLFRAVWARLMDEFSTRRYTEMMMNGESKAYPAFLKLLLNKEEIPDRSLLPVQYICQQEDHKASIHAVFPEKGAADWIETVSADLERFLFQMNVPYRIVKLEQTGAEAGIRYQWRLDMWFPVEEMYTELCRIGCSPQNEWNDERAGYYGPLWVGRVEGLSGNRLFLAVAENGYDQRGRIRIPSVLVPYMAAEWIP